MTKKKKNQFIIIGIIILLGLWLWGAYNSLIVGRENVDNAWAQVETQYQRRLDLIPNLVNAVKGEMKQEQAIFLGIAQARSQYAGAKTTNDKIKAANNVESALSRLLVVMENYPQLKSSENVQDLMTELAGTENRVNVARMRFNDQVKLYNLKTKRFPGNLVASLFGFDEANYFKAVSGADVAPTVNLDLDTNEK